MLMKAKELERLIFNPQHTGRILHHFLSGVLKINPRGIKTELFYLVLPIIYNAELCEKLSRLNKNSKLNAFMKFTENQIFMTLINEKIKDYKETSKQGLIFLSSIEDVHIDSFISIGKRLSHTDIKDVQLKEICKASYNLGIILGKEPYLNVFLKMRIFEI